MRRRFCIPGPANGMYKETLEKYFFLYDLFYFCFEINYRKLPDTWKKLHSLAKVGHDAIIQATGGSIVFFYVRDSEKKTIRVTKIFIEKKCLILGTP